MKSLFDQTMYKDKWLLLIGIPLITLLMQHIGLSWTTIKSWVQHEAYFPTLLYNLLGVAVIFLASKWLFLQLDRRLPYRPHFRKRFFIQLGLLLLLVLTIGELHSYLYIYFWNNGEGWESRYITDLPFTILLTLLLNFVYIGFFLHYESRQEPKALPSEMEKSESLEVSLGSKNILLEQEEIALLFSQNKLTLVLTLQGKRFVYNDSLKQATQHLNAAHFFQANRQVVVNRTVVKGYTRLPSRKLELLLEPASLLDDPVRVSKAKSPRFLDWLSA